MKIVTKHNNPQIIEPFNWENATYPTIGISDNNRIVLFTSKATGVVLQESEKFMENHPVGYAECGWNINLFKPHYEPITIQMEKE